MLIGSFYIQHLTNVLFSRWLSSACVWKSTVVDTLAKTGTSGFCFSFIGDFVFNELSKSIMYFSARWVTILPRCQWTNFFITSFSRLCEVHSTINYTKYYNTLEYKSLITFYSCFDNPAVSWCAIFSFNLFIMVKRDSLVMDIIFYVSSDGIWNQYFRLIQKSFSNHPIISPEIQDANLINFIIRGDLRKPDFLLLDVNIFTFWSDTAISFFRELFKINLFKI